MPLTVEIVAAIFGLYMVGRAHANGAYTIMNSTLYDGSLTWWLLLLGGIFALAHGAWKAEKNRRNWTKRR
jgi:hypothetical protein